MTTATDSFSSSIDFRDRLGYGLEALGDTIKKPYYRATEEVVHALVTPIRPGQFGNLDTRIAEMTRRFFAVLLSTVTSLMCISSYLVGGLVEAAGELVTQKAFHYIQGTLQRWNPNRFTIFDLNACMYWGGLPIPFGGVLPARLRMEKLEKLIREKDADFVTLQEVSFGPGRDLAHRLKDKYAHFYTNIGGLQAKTNFWSAGSELFFASKAPIVSEPRFIPFPAPMAEKMGFFCVETPACWILTAHFPDGKKEMWAQRRELLDLVHSTMTQLKQETGKPCCLTGDLNIRTDEYAFAGIGDKFFDPGTRQFHDFNEKTSTCTNLLVSKMTGAKEPTENPFETDDYVLFDKESEHRFDVSVHLGKETYNLEDPDKAISDHRYYFVTVEEKNSF